MKGETPLDYAEFQLTLNRTRCELFISADGSMEKLASGFFKPFVTHLRAAEMQATRGNQVIRLEAQGGLSNHSQQRQQDGNFWFCKGTLERFVRFVSTPEIIERVKTIEDELTQLEQVRSALLHTFTQTPQRCMSGNQSGTQQRKEAINEDQYNGTDASKKELLRAMEARLTALHQEQHMAFTHARAAGFDSNNVTHLIIFAEYFGAERLKAACTHFLALSKRQEATSSPSPGSPAGNLPNDEGLKLAPNQELWPHGPKRRLDFGAGKVQRNHPVPSSAISKVPTTTDELSTSISRNSDLFILPDRGSFLRAPMVRDEAPCIGNSSLAEAENAADSGTMTKECGRKPAETPCMDSEDSRRQIAQAELPARRLSVQAAISLFESKKDSSDPPFRKIAKQDSSKTVTESATSPSEKSVLKRWSVASPCSQEEPDKKPTVSELAKVCEPRVKVFSDEASKVSSSAEQSSDGPHSTTAATDAHIRENFKRSLNELLHHDNNKRIAKLNMEMQQEKRSASPVHRSPFDTVAGSPVDPESKGQPNQATSNRAISLSSTREGANLTSQARPPPPPPPPPVALGMQARASPPLPAPPCSMPATMKPFNTSAKEPNLQPMASTPRMEQFGKIELGSKEHNTSRLLCKPHELSSQRLKAAQIVPLQMPVQSLEHDESKPIFDAAPAKQEKIFGKRTNTATLQEPPGSDRHLGKSMSNSKTPIKKKESSPASALNTSVDLHMQALVKMVEHQYTNLSLNGIDIQREQKGEGKQNGRFYEQYSKLRDAKLRREHPAKKAEREAKLKAMQETLERRKAEMESQAVILSKKKIRGMERGTNTRPRKAAIAEQKDLTDKEDYTNQPLDYSNPTSPTSMPHSTTNQFLLKSPAPSKTLTTLSKPSGAPRNPIRPTKPSLKSTTKTLTATPGQGKSLSPGNTSTDSTGLKATLSIKDVAKSSLIRVAGSARVHPRSNKSASDGVFPGDEGSLHGITEKKESRLVTKKMVVSPAVSKSLPPEAVTLPRNPEDEQEGATDFPTAGKGSQEARSFLRKGQGIGPGAGPGVLKQKASDCVDTSKSSDEEASIADQEEEIDLGTEHKPMGEYQPENNGTENARLDNEWDATVASSVPMECTVDDQSKSPDSQPSDDVALSYLPENWKICHDTTGLVEEPHKATTNMNPVTQGSFLQHLQHMEKEGSHMLLELANKSNESVQHKPSLVKSSLSFREASMQDSHIGSPSPASDSHDYSSILQRGTVLGQFSPPRANSVDLPMGSPALWNTLQGSKYMADMGRAPSGTYKHVPLPPKEPSKGLKRLLHFGRKSRQSETIMADCASVSTTSEGDDDTEEVRESGNLLSEELLRKIRMQKKGLDYGNLGDYSSSPDQDLSQYTGSSIPHAPANFKLREEHLSGSNLIKAPSRSFFSLSSFRSKGSEAKAR